MKRIYQLALLFVLYLCCGLAVFAFLMGHWGLFWVSVVIGAVAALAEYRINKRINH